MLPGKYFFCLAITYGERQVHGQDRTSTRHARNIATKRQEHLRNPPFPGSIPTYGMQQKWLFTDSNLYCREQTKLTVTVMLAGGENATGIYLLLQA